MKREKGKGVVEGQMEEYVESREGFSSSDNRGKSVKRGYERVWSDSMSDTLRGKRKQTNGRDRVLMAACWSLDYGVWSTSACLEVLQR